MKNIIQKNKEIIMYLVFGVLQRLLILLLLYFFKSFTYELFIF